jgi:hypothetical protein
MYKKTILRKYQLLRASIFSEHIDIILNEDITSLSLLLFEIPLNDVLK